MAHPIIAQSSPDQLRYASRDLFVQRRDVFLQRKDAPMSVFVAALALSAIVAQAGPGQVHVWTATEVSDRGKALGQKLDAQKVASEVVSTDGNRTFMVAHREGSGQAELHDKQADIMVITVGAVTMVYGGTIVDGKTTAPGETRGASIRGGTEVKLGAGDVIHIPAHVPHQMKLDPGKQVTYFVTKVVQ
jgi:mannose-6-phosphate isomerase-like protein (cupin superfamily)